MDKQKLIEIAKNGPFWPKACGQKALPDKSAFKRTKIGGNCQNVKIVQN